MDIDASNPQARDLAVHANLSGVRALLLVGGRPGGERFGEVPLALIDVLGRNILLRTIDRLRGAGVSEIAVVSDTEPLPPRPASNLCTFSVAGSEVFWDEALRVFRKLTHQSESVLVLRLGAWAEVDYAAMVAQHRCRAASVTQACLPGGGEGLDIFLISSGSRSEAAALLRGELRDRRSAPAVYETYGYVQAMGEPADLRKLVLDAFAGEAAIAPRGRELRPGIWVGRGAHIHRDARIVAPAFIGAFCDVHREAVITRGSALEHHSELDCAVIVDNASVLPYTRVGAGLEVQQSVVGFRQVYSLQHRIAVEVEDPHLIGATYQYSRRAISAAQWLLAFLPTALWKLIFESGPREKASAPEALGSATPVLGDPNLSPIEVETKAYREMAAARRYGDE